MKRVVNTSIGTSNFQEIGSEFITINEVLFFSARQDFRRHSGDSGAGGLQLDRRFFPLLSCKWIVYEKRRKRRFRS